MQVGHRGHRRNGETMFFPLLKFWTYSPIGYACAIAWNISELFGVKCPFGGWAFGKIVGAKKKP